MRTQSIEHEEWDPLETGESEEEIRMDNSRWDTLLASSESQKLLETMARLVNNFVQVRRSLNKKADC